MLANIPRLITAYYTCRPDPTVPSQRVAFGTSGHRGSSLDLSFNEAHILAITQAICEYRTQESVSGPLFLGMDTHALSEPAWTSALEVLAANGVDVMIDSEGGYTPTPALSHAILTYNRGRADGRADGIVITPSHNPPEDGGFKYNPPSGGPADTGTTSWVENRANQFLAGGLRGVLRMPYEDALKASTTHRYDYVSTYVNDLEHVLDMDAIRGAHLNVGVDPLGGAGVAYWSRISERYGVPLTVLNSTVDPTFRFMSVDWDGKIRMDCSSPYAMAGLIALKDRFDVAFACGGMILLLFVLTVWGASRIFSRENTSGAQAPSISDVLLASPSECLLSKSVEREPNLAATPSASGGCISSCRPACCSPRRTLWSGP